MYTKNIEKVATYRILKSQDGAEETIHDKTHAQIDYILVERRWRNTITNAETHTRANINSDHFPLVFNTRIKLKQLGKGGQGRAVYRQCDSTQQDNLNYDLWNETPSNNDKDGKINESIKQNPELPWCWNTMSTNNNITFDFVIGSKKQMHQIDNS